MITKGQKVEFVYTKKEKIFGKYDKDRIIMGTVIYINGPHKWFLIEYPGIDRKLRIGFKFCDIGQTVRVCSDNTAEFSTVVFTDEKRSFGLRKNHLDRQKTIAEYLASKLKVMRELGVTPTKREWDHISSLNSESNIDAAVRAVIKKRWAERDYI